MSKMAWNAFVKNFPNAPAFMAQVSARLPKGLHFDGHNLKLPTPGRLFEEWMEKNLTVPTAEQLTVAEFARMAEIMGRG